MSVCVILTARARESPEFAAGFMFQSPAVSCPPSAMFPYNERGYLTDTTDTCCGEALAVTCPKGNARITAQSPFGKSTLTVLCDRQK